MGHSANGAAGIRSDSSNKRGHRHGGVAPIAAARKDNSKKPSFARNSVETFIVVDEKHAIAVQTFHVNQTPHVSDG